MTDLSSTLERLVPDLVERADETGRKTLLLHLERYEFAAEQITEGARVLDLACGVGYGTRLMADAVEHAAAFVGVDLSEESVAYARERYGNDRIRYRVGDAMQFSDEEGFDVIVSLETIEHLPQPTEFIASIKGSLKPNGLFIGSVPTTPSVDANPHHLHDFTANSFRRMLSDLSFEEISAFEQVQPFNPFPVVLRSERRLEDMRENLIRYYLSHPGAAYKRAISTVIHGFKNKYLTVVARNRDG